LSILAERERQTCEVSITNCLSTFLANFYSDNECFLLIFSGLVIMTKAGQLVNYSDLGLCLQSLGKYDMAEEYVKQALLLTTGAIQFLEKKLVQDSPQEYHSQTGALIVGDPVVG
ncbi:hypothetical protein pdam_00025743, partial [Pocillopora damicornis]